MSNIRPKYTGLPMVIWVSPQTGLEKHGPRIKVQKKHGEKAEAGNWVTVTIEDEPQLIGEGLGKQDLKQIQLFIEKNKDVLIKLWNDELDPLELPKHLKKV